MILCSQKNKIIQVVSKLEKQVFFGKNLQCTITETVLKVLTLKQQELQYGTLFYGKLLAGEAGTIGSESDVMVNSDTSTTENINMHGGNIDAGGFDNF